MSRPQSLVLRCVLSVTILFAIAARVLVLPRLIVAYDIVTCAVGLGVELLVLLFLAMGAWRWLSVALCGVVLTQVAYLVLGCTPSVCPCGEIGFLMGANALSDALGAVVTAGGAVTCLFSGPVSKRGLGWMLTGALAAIVTVVGVAWGARSADTWVAGGLQSDFRAREDRVALEYVGEGGQRSCRVLTLRGRRNGIGRGVSHVIAVGSAEGTGLFECGSIRGAPVRDRFGSIRWFVDRVYGRGPEGVVYGLRDAASLHPGAEHPKLRGKAVVAPSQRLVPGSAVVLLWTWGDIQIGAQGTVASVGSDRGVLLIDERYAAEIPSTAASLAVAVATPVCSGEGILERMRVDTGVSEVGSSTSYRVDRVDFDTTLPPSGVVVRLGIETLGSARIERSATVGRAGPKTGAWAVTAFSGLIEDAAPKRVARYRVRWSIGYRVAPLERAESSESVGPLIRIVADAAQAMITESNLRLSEVDIMRIDVQEVSP